MEEPRSLDSLFTDRIYRIPDYQRGYAWQPEQLKDFWEDLVNLAGDRSHYTGVLTLKKVAKPDIVKTDREFWLVEDHSYSVYHIVDGQQRLTTAILFLKAFVNVVSSLPDNKDKAPESIYVTDSLNLQAVIGRFLYKLKPTGDQFRTYKFGYTVDNPSYNYLRFNILGEDGGGEVEETFYTLNLSNAVRYFAEQLREQHLQHGLDGLGEIYKKLTRRFLFNEYVIKDEFDVFVAFETMNNRGKRLSDLELLKNRLIYLTTLYHDSEMDAASRQSLRELVNDAWKEIYHQLGRNKSKPLNDDDFLRAHWIMYFKYSRKTGRDYIRFLLDEQFTPKNVHKQLEKEVALDQPTELRSDEEQDDDDEAQSEVETPPSKVSQLRPTEIRDYVASLRRSAVHWYKSFHPDHGSGIAPEECQAIDRLNRVGIAYFRPLVMAVLKDVEDKSDRIEIFNRIERFIFLYFRLTSIRQNTRSAEFYNLSRALDRGEISVQQLLQHIDGAMSYVIDADRFFRTEELRTLLNRRFKQGSGYYGWPTLRYILYEYEMALTNESRQKKVDWQDLLKSDKDKVSIEHIYPQTPGTEWEKPFEKVPHKLLPAYSGSLGNLLLLSQSINSSLQNDGFEDKKRVRRAPDGTKLRNGYEDGSHSEIEVAGNADWGPDEIRDRGMRLLRFMEKRWNFSFKDEEDSESLLFLDDNEGK